MIKTAMLKTILSVIVFSVYATAQTPPADPRPAVQQAVSQIATAQGQVVAYVTATAVQISALNDQLASLTAQLAAAQQAAAANAAVVAWLGAYLPIVQAAMADPQNVPLVLAYGHAPATASGLSTATGSINVTIGAPK